MITASQPLQRLMGEQTPLPLLTHEEEIALAKRIVAGHAASRQLKRRSPSTEQRRSLKHRLAEGHAAREALVLHNLRLVLDIAGHYTNASLTYDDLVQEGILGLLKAADRYDPARGTRFATFAVWWIRQSIGRAIANYGRSVRLPVNRVHKISQLKRLATHLEQQGGQSPSVDELAHSAGISPVAAASLMQDSQMIISLDAPVEQDERDAVEQVADRLAVDPEKSAADSALRHIIEQGLARLDSREAEILRLRYGLGGGEARPLRAIAAAWRMSPEGVRQISQRALSRLRSMPEVRGLSDYLNES